MHYERFGRWYSPDAEYATLGQAAFVKRLAVVDVAVK